MKKTFFQLGILSTSGIFIFLVHLAFAGFVLSVKIDDLIFTICLFVGLIGPCISGLTVSLYARISFDDESIKIIGDSSLEKTKEQLRRKDQIAYSEIENINLVRITNSDSRRRPYSNVRMALLSRLYFEFVLVNGKTKWCYVDMFSKRQRKQMLNIINQKTGRDFDYDKLNLIDFTKKKQKKPKEKL